MMALTGFIWKHQIYMMDCIHYPQKLGHFFTLAQSIINIMHTARNSSNAEKKSDSDANY